jgi:hypothetical protein
MESMGSFLSGIVGRAPIGLADALGGRGMGVKLLGGTAGARHELAPTVGTEAAEHTLGTGAAERALERADDGVGRARWQIAIAALTVGSKLEHDAPPRGAGAQRSGLLSWTV